MNKILIALCILTLSACGLGYKNRGDAVYYKNWNEGVGYYENKINADPKTFEVLKFDSYAKDAKHVFYGGSLIDSADAPTFEAIGSIFARDKNRGYYAIKPVQSSNGRTFRQVEGSYSTDGTDVFYMTTPLGVKNAKDFKVLKDKYSTDGIDIYFENHPLHVENIKEFKRLTAQQYGPYEWATDGKRYYFQNYKVPSEDYANIVICESIDGICKDKQWVYKEDHRLNYTKEGKCLYDTIDAATFKMVNTFEYRDTFGCISAYNGRVKCEK